MYINSVSDTPRLFYQAAKFKDSNVFHKANQSNDIAFQGGANPEVLRNQLKIFLTQDIWAEKLAAKIPETPLEKEVLLEILQNRQHLDRFAKLNNEKYRLINEISNLNFILKNDPSNKEIPHLMQKLINKGNLESVFKTLDKKIDLELKKNKPAFDYIKNIEKLEEDYRANKLIKDSKIDKFWFQIKKNNINKDNKYSTKELIDIIENNKITTDSKKVQEVAKPLTKKQLLEKVSILYEQYLRENVDVYEGRVYHYNDALKGQKTVMSRYAKAINKYPEAKKQFPKIYEAIENKFMHKIERLDGIDIYPIGEIWKDMKTVEYEVKQLNNSIDVLNKQLEKRPGDKGILESISKNKESLKELKEQWLYGLEASMKLEAVNQQRISDAGRLADYNYLVSENKTMKRYKDAYNLLHENNYTIPEDKWPQVMGLV